ncbi:MAG: hypothetical protein KDD24_07370, partial [Flavobacteriales bacterium]|nr:hypothetical protein [Flavobacteriales bacterium]
TELPRRNWGANIVVLLFYQHIKRFFFYIIFKNNFFTILQAIVYTKLKHYVRESKISNGVCG